MTYALEEERIRCLLIEQKENNYFLGLRLEHLTGTLPDFEAQTEWVRMSGWWKTPKLRISELEQHGDSL